MSQTDKFERGSAPTSTERAGNTQRKGITRRRVVTGGAVLVGAAALSAAGGYAAFLTPSADVRNYADHLVDDQRALRAGEVRVTFLGTTTLLVDDGTTQLLFDAFITDISLSRAILGTLQTDEAKVDSVLAQVGADRVKATFVSHSHYDHVLDAAYIANQTGATLHGSASTLNGGRGGDVPEKQLREYRLGEPTPVGDFSVTVLASQHSPGTKGGDGTPIPQPLMQPAKGGDFYEGGSFDFLVTHGGRSMLIKASAGYRPEALDDVRADVMCCGTAGTVGTDSAYRAAFYDQTVAKVRPNLLVPLHWNDFFHPVTPHLAANFKAIDDVAAAWDYFIQRLSASHATFAPMEGYASIILFGPSGRG